MRVHKKVEEIRPDGKMSTSKDVQLAAEISLLAQLGWIVPNNPVIPFSRVGADRFMAGWSATCDDLAIPPCGGRGVKKRTVSNQSGKADGPQHLAALESNVFSKLHSLIAHCAITKYEDGEVRRPGWFTVKTMGSAWVIQVKEPDAALQLSAVGQTLDDALALIDILLTSEEAPWEPDPFLKRQSGNGKKSS